MISVTLKLLVSSRTPSLLGLVVCPSLTMICLCSYSCGGDATLATPTCQECMYWLKPSIHVNLLTWCVIRISSCSAEFPLKMYINHVQKGSTVVCRCCKLKKKKMISIECKQERLMLMFPCLCFPISPDLKYLSRYSFKDWLPQTLGLLPFYIAPVAVYKFTTWFGEKKRTKVKQNSKPVGPFTLPNHCQDHCSSYKVLLKVKLHC